MRCRDRFLSTLVLALAGAAVSCDDATDVEFPSQAINLLVGFAQGGGSDQWARSIAEVAEPALGVPLTVVNLAGEGGLLALEEYVSLEPTGYDLLSIVDIYAAAYALGDTDIHPAEDVIPLMVGNITVCQIYIGADDPRFSTWDEVVAYGQANPGMTVASVGTELDLEGVSIMMLEDAFDLELGRTYIEDPTDRFTAPLTGATDLLIEQVSDVQEVVQSGEIVPVLTLWSSRPTGFEDVPAVTEYDSGFQPLVRMRGIAALPQVPEDRLEFLKGAFREAFQSAAFQAHLSENALDVLAYPDDPVEAFREQVQIYQDFYCSTLGLGCPPD
jgi:tripartite-type tricarboxylate transporter receptor subunit TctC